MKRVIHPSSMEAWVRILFSAMFFTLLLWFGKQFLGELLTPTLTFIWGVAFVLCVLAWIIRRFRTIELSEDSIIMKVGLLNIKTIFIPYRTITDANMKQNLLERVLSIGTLEINTAGASEIKGKMSEIRYSELQNIINILKGKEAEIKHERVERSVRDRK